MPWIDGTTTPRVASTLEFALRGTGVPAVAAPVGTLYLRTDSSGSQLWVKETGVGTAGWAPVPTSSGVYNVKDYGAVGDGTTDDTAAITAAITAGAGAVVYFPVGTYKISSALTIGANTTFLGASSRGSKLTLANSSNSCIFQTLDDGAQRYGLNIRSLGFDGNAANQTGTSPIIDVRAMNESVFDDLYMVNSRGSCIRIGQATIGMYCTVPIITRIVARGDVTNTQGSALELNSGSSDAVVQNCDFGFFSLASAVTLSGHPGATISNMNCWQGYYGYLLYQSNRTRMVNCLSDYAKRHGFVFQESSDLQIESCQARESSQATASTYDGFSVQGATGGTRPNNVLLSNCRAMGVQARVGIALNQHLSYVRVVGGSMVGNAIAATVIDTDVLDYEFRSVAGVADTFQVIATVTYSASMTPDAQAGKFQKITVTNGTAMTINAPANPATGEEIYFDILNSSGGAMGVITWNAAFKLAGAFTNPASTKRRTIGFYFDGTSWIEQQRAPADI